MDLFGFIFFFVIINVLTAVVTSILAESVLLLAFECSTP